MTASASGIRAGQAYVELLADDSQLRAGLASAQKRLADWGSQIRQVGLTVFAAGAGMLAPLLAATRQFAASGDALAKMASRTGMSVELLSELKYAAGLSGSSLEDLEKASRKLSVTIVAAMKGSQSALDALGGSRLAKQLAALTPDQQFLAVARAIGQIPEPTKRAAAAVAVFGRSGTALLPLIAEMDTLRGEARKLGATMSTDQAQQASALQDAWERVLGAIAQVATAIGTALAPALTRAANEILPMLVAAKRWIAHNQAVVVTIAKVGAALAVAGGAMVAFSTVFTAAAWVVRVVSTAIALVTGTIGALRSVVAGLSAVWGVLNANLLTTSAGLWVTVAASALASTALTGARAGVLALALGFGRVRMTAIAALSGMPALLARIAAGAAMAAGSLRGVTVPGSFGPQRVSQADHGRAVAGAGAEVAAGLAGRITVALRSAWTAIAALPTRLGTAFVSLGRTAVASLASIRTALAGVQVVATLLGGLVVGGVARAFAAIPSLAARALATIPALFASAWGGMAQVLAASGSLVSRALLGLLGTAVTVGNALAVGLGRGVTALPSLFFAAIGLIATAVQAIPGLVMGSFAVLRTAVLALPGLFSAAFTLLPALVGLAMNPVVLLGAAIVGLWIYLYQTTDGGRQALSQLGQAFAAVKDDAVTAIGGIADALSAGDIQGAVAILWSFIRLEWTRGVAWAENLLQAFAGGVAKLFLHVGFGINAAFWTVVDGIQTAIEWVTAGIVKLFTTVIGSVASKVSALLELVGALDAGTADRIANLSSTITVGVDQVRDQRAAERDQKRADFQGLWDEKVQGVNDWMTEGMQGRDADIDAKRAELDQAIAAAQRARTTTGPDGAGPNTPGESSAPTVPDLDTSALSAELAARMNTVQVKVDTLGMFNTAAIGEMGVGGTAAERGLQAAEKTARNTERIMTVVETNDLAFE